MRYTFLASIAVIFVGQTSHAADWPAWRGSNNNGITTEAAPLTWSRTQNVRWKVPLPGPGNSTPIVVGDRIFLTQAVDGGKQRSLIAYQRADGKKLWQVDLPCSTDETTHKQNPPCSASPVTDGKAVYAHFA